MAGRRARPSETTTQALSRELALALEPWFIRGHRDMPWRRTRDPYAIWVSEIMLQQTRVETVQRYYDAFLRRFPDVASLAAADEQAVLEQWSGLGYYRRARFLHAGARHVMAERSGSIPDDPEALRSIPGIGAYTAGAIASIAFDRPAALVDGNVARVLSRVEGIEDAQQQLATAPGHWRRVSEILAHGTPRILAQALMELGATVCTPRSPRCSECPVRSSCAALGRGRVDQIPAVRKKAAQAHESWLALAVTWRGRLLLVRRPAEGLLADLWCLPLLPCDGLPAVAPAKAPGLVATPTWADAPLPEVRHVFTHRVWTLHPWAGRAAREPRVAELPDERQCLIAPGQRPPGGVPRVTQKLLERVGFGAP